MTTKTSTTATTATETKTSKTSTTKTTTTETTLTATTKTATTKTATTTTTLSVADASKEKRDLVVKLIVPIVVGVLVLLTVVIVCCTPKRTGSVDLKDSSWPGYPQSPQAAEQSWNGSYSAQQFGGMGGYVGPQWPAPQRVPSRDGGLRPQPYEGGFEPPQLQIKVSPDRRTYYQAPVPVSPVPTHPSQIKVSPDRRTYYSYQAPVPVSPVPTHPSYPVTAHVVSPGPPAAGTIHSVVDQWQLHPQQSQGGGGGGGGGAIISPGTNLFSVGAYDIANREAEDESMV